MYIIPKENSQQNSMEVGGTSRWDLRWGHHETWLQSSSTSPSPLLGNSGSFFPSQNSSVPSLSLSAGAADWRRSWHPLHWRILRAQSWIRTSETVIEPNLAQQAGTSWPVKGPPKPHFVIAQVWRRTKPEEEKCALASSCQVWGSAGLPVWCGEQEVLAGAPRVTGRGHSQSGEEPAKDCSNTFHDLTERGNKDVGH